MAQRIAFDPLPSLSLFTDLREKALFPRTIPFIFYIILDPLVELAS